MKRGLKILALVLSLLLMVLIARTLRVRPAVKAPPLAPLSIDELGAARRFAGALRIPTISHADREKNDPKQFEAMHAYLESQFPRVHAALRREVVNGQSLLYTWSGRDRGARPILLLAHMDVVPVEPGTESIKDNVLPSEAHAVINFRLLPGDSGRAVQDHLRAAMADDDIEIAIEDGPVSEASPVSTTDSVAFRLLERTINEVFPDALVTPGLNVGATDSRHYTDVIEARYNIRPVRLSLEDLPRIHGTDERTSVQGYADVVRFYVRLMQSAAG
jgi:acetylornithine deacetylase/succinyl-diaminopimelate desuccinylase-like protein